MSARERKGVIAWPVIALPVSGALMLIAHNHGASDWVIFLILGGWWVFFGCWYAKRYR
jgi:hypothetical protein